MKNLFSKQCYLITPGLRTTVLLLALAGAGPSLCWDDPFASKPPTADELHARRLYGMYKADKQREVEIKNRIHRHPIDSPEEAGKPDFAMVAG